MYRETDWRQRDISPAGSGVDQEKECPEKEDQLEVYTGES
jgi:hypothetical protein